MRVSDKNPIVLAVESGAPGPRGTVRVAADGLSAIVDPASGRVSDVAVRSDDAPASSAIEWPITDAATVLSGGRQAFVDGLSDAAGEPCVKILQELRPPGQGVRETKLPPLRFPAGHGRLSVMSPLEEDGEHALRFVLADERRAYMVIQRPPPAVATAVPVPGATHALVHGSRGFAVGPTRALVSADGGASWSDIPPPRGFAAAVAALARPQDAHLLVSPFGAGVGELVRVGWGPPEPPPPDGPPPGATPVPLEDREDPAPALVCTSAGPSASPPPKGKRVDVLLQRALGAELARLGATGHPTITQGDAAGFTPSIAFSFDDTARVWVAGWLDSFDLGAAPRTWSTSTPAWATSTPWLTLLASQGGRALIEIVAGDHRMLVRVDPPATTETAETTKAAANQGELGAAAARRGPLAWVDGGELVLCRWGEGPRVVLPFPGSNTLVSAEDPVPGGIVIRTLDPAFGAYRLLPYPAPGAPVAPPNLDGWTRFDARLRAPRPPPRVRQEALRRERPRARPPAPRAHRRHRPAHRRGGDLRAAPDRQGGVRRVGVGALRRGRRADVPARGSGGGEGGGRGRGGAAAGVRVALRGGGKTAADVLS